MEVDLSSSRGASPWAEGGTDPPDGGGASRGPASPALKRHLIASEDSCRAEASSAPTAPSGRIQSLDRDKNISFLLKELDALRDVNNKLQEQLLQKEKELKRREAEEELRVEQQEAQSWEKPAAMLEELVDAQKNRDHSLMSRLLLANEERDEALLRARRLQHAATHQLDPITLEDSDMDVEELLRCICNADSVQEVEQFGPILVQHLRLARQRRSDITAQEMKAVMEERDSTVAKCKHLEEDLIQEREQRTSKDELLRLQRERDRAVDDRHRLEAELQAIRASHSCQNATPPSQPLLLGNETPPLLVQLQQLSKEKRSVEVELQRCQEAEREASERVQRLERLVEVLRKKVGTGSVRTVI